MKKGKKSALLLLGSLAGILSFVPVYAQEQKQVDVVFTHDLHSYLDSYEEKVDGEMKNVGGMARLKTLLDQQREKNPDTLVVDAGDFSMGTMFHTMFSTDALEYRMLGQLGFDAVTLGNHEFDFGSEALAQMFEAAREEEVYLPPVVVSNVDWNSENQGSKRIKDAAADLMQDYVMVEKGDISIAVVGAFGKDALDCSPTCELTFEDPVTSIQKTVDKIEKQEDADMIVCVSHSGTWANSEKSEDELLAKAVPELDLIISGHTHSVLEEPLIHGDTAIVSCGEYGKNTGVISMKQKDDGRWKVEEYELISMDEQIEADSGIETTLTEFKKRIDSDYLGQFGYTADQILVENDISFESNSLLLSQHTEHALGNLMSDAYRYTVDRLGTDNPKVDVAIVPAGVVRGTYPVGDITVKNVFDSFSLGNGPDGIAGYPLIGVYLTGEELKIAMEIDGSISDLMEYTRLYNSGISFSYNPNRLILNKVTDVWMNPELCKDEREELEKDKLYYVVTDLYTGRMLSTVTDMSYGLLKIEPKFADGTKVQNFEDCIVYDNKGNEVKAWVAIARYMESFTTEGDGKVSAYYQTFHDRKVVEEDTSIGAWLKNPSKYFWMILAVVLVVLGILAGILAGIVRVGKKIRNK